MKCNIHRKSTKINVLQPITYTIPMMVRRLACGARNPWRTPSQVPHFITGWLRRAEWIVSGSAGGQEARVFNTKGEKLRLSKRGKAENQSATQVYEHLMTSLPVELANFTEKRLVRNSLNCSYLCRTN